MYYRCTRCDWSGPWDEMIHETMCPKCRAKTLPLHEDENAPQQVVHTVCTPPSPPQ